MTLDEWAGWLSGLQLGELVEAMKAVSAELQARDLHFAAESVDQAVVLLEKRLYGRLWRRPT